MDTLFGAGVAKSASHLCLSSTTLIFRSAAILHA